MFGETSSKRKFYKHSAPTAASHAIDWNAITVEAGKIEDKRRFPVAVIGAGLGGLCCGALVARAGFPVTVVEQLHSHGGYARAFERANGKFSFEISLHGTSLCDNGAARTLEQLGVLENLRLVELPEIYKVHTPESDFTVPQKDPGKFIEMVAARFPKEAKGIAGYIREIIAAEEEFDRYNRRISAGREGWKLLFPIRYPKMWKTGNKTLEEHLRKHVSDPECIAVLGCLWPYYGLPPSKLSAFYYAVATGGYLKNGSYYVGERSQELSDLLAKSLKEAGGEIVYEKKVERISMGDGRVSGVELSDGKSLAARAVVANCSAPTVFSKMLPQGAVPEKFLKKLEKCKPSISCFTVWLGLNRVLRGKIDGFAFHMQRAKDPDMDYEDCLNGRVDRGYYSVTIFDNLFEGYSQPGCSTVMLLFLCGYGPWKEFEEDYRAGEKKDYRKRKRQWTDILIKRAEKDLIPGLSDMIEVTEAASPLTSWRFTGNKHGAIYGYEQSVGNSFSKRISVNPPVKGLFLAGAWSDPGGGFVGVLQSGAWAFQSLIKYFGTWE